MAPATSERQKARNRKYAREHAEQLKAYYRKYQEANRDRICARNRKRRQEHLEELSAREREYYAKNRDRLRAANRKYYSEHRDKLRVLKKASQQRRRQEKPEEIREYQRKYYAANRTQYLRQRTERKRRKIDKLNEYKATLKCSECGQSFPDHPSVIEFHHTGKDPKADTIGALMGENPSSRRLQTELAKCIPLCANCHRRIHYFESRKNADGGAR